MLRLRKEEHKISMVEVIRLRQEIDSKSIYSHFHPPLITRFLLQLILTVEKNIEKLKLNIKQGFI